MVADDRSDDCGRSQRFVRARHNHITGAGAFA
jgi:hypothetical protein